MGQPPRFRHIAWTVGLVPLPCDFTEHEPTEPLKKIIEMSKALQTVKGNDEKLAQELDQRIIELYGLSTKDLSELNQYIHDLGIPTIHECS
jgi:hypothetical protein